MPVSEIEVAYYNMAKRAGIDMEECRLFPVDGVCHFLTKRFDRKNGEKIYVQTLAAINPEARSYEDLVATCRELSISETEIKQLFCRMVFNVMANNTDDHNKNFSFLFEKGGKWHLAPAYDVTYIFNTNGTGPNIERRFSICGKVSEITMSDLLDFARQNDIRNARAIIDNVADAISRFDDYAARCGVGQPWRSIIQKTLCDNLSAFGYGEHKVEAEEFYKDRYGRTVSDMSVSVNRKGYYEISANIESKRRKRFIRRNMPLYAELGQLDIFKLSAIDKIKLIEQLFPPE